MQRKNIVRFGLGIALIVLMVASISHFFAGQRVNAESAGALPAGASAALTHAVDSLRVPGVQVPATWQVASAQLAPHPEALPTRSGLAGPASAVWCARISPGVVVLASAPTSHITLDHFIIAQLATQWVAYSVDGTTASAAQGVYASVGCTNG